MREDKIIETEDDVIDLGAASEVTFGDPLPKDFEAINGVDHKSN